MAEIPPINITIDQDALNEQIREAFRGMAHEFGMRLRLAADEMDPGFIENIFNDRYEAGFQAGKAAGATK